TFLIDSFLRSHPKQEANWKSRPPPTLQLRPGKLHNLDSHANTTRNTETPVHSESASSQDFPSGILSRPHFPAYGRDRAATTAQIKHPSPELDTYLPQSSVLAASL